MTIKPHGTNAKRKVGAVCPTAPPVRLPLTAKEREAKLTYYQTQDIDRILKTFKQRPGFDRVRFARMIENELSAGRKNPPPSAATRGWNRLASESVRLRDRLGGLDHDALLDLIAAGEDLAKADGRLPDFEPERIELPPLDGKPDSASWFLHHPVDRQIAKYREALDWLERCARRASERAADHHPETNPLHDFVRAALGLLVRRRTATRSSNRGPTVTWMNARVSRYCS